MKGINKALCLARGAVSDPSVSPRRKPISLSTFSASTQPQIGSAIHPSPAVETSQTGAAGKHSSCLIGQLAIHCLMNTATTQRYSTVLTPAPFLREVEVDRKGLDKLLLFDTW